MPCVRLPLPPAHERIAVERELHVSLAAAVRAARPGTSVDRERVQQRVAAMRAERCDGGLRSGSGRIAGSWAVNDQIGGSALRRRGGAFGLDAIVELEPESRRGATEIEGTTHPPPHRQRGDLGVLGGGCAHRK